MSAPARTWLYVPAHRADRAAKALRAGADAVVLDLEDSVPVDRKDEARDNAVQLLADAPTEGVPIWVRINPLDSPWGRADLEALGAASGPLGGIRLPRVEDQAAVAEAARVAQVPLQLLFETARGLLAAHTLAQADPLVAGIGLGEADLSADLRVQAPGLDWARGWIVAASRAAGLASPIQSVYTAVSDVDGLRRTTLEGRAHGFFGRSIIHPAQIAVVHDAYRPTPEAIDRAREIVSAYERAASDGESAVLTGDGRFVDPAVVAQAQVVLDLVGRDGP